MTIIFKIVASVLIIGAAITIPGMIIDYITGFKYEWIGKAVDTIFVLFLPFLCVLGIGAFICLAGLFLCDIWCA